MKFAALQTISCRMCCGMVSIWH